MVPNGTGTGFTIAHCNRNLFGHARDAEGTGRILEYATDPQVPLGQLLRYV